jgi:NAD(P)-dependent dehydrogenase (short-subunit alcohol dehydrogenase family)
MSNTGIRSLRALTDMRGRVACITGGAGHIGAAIAESIAELGADIVVVDVSQARCDEIANEIAGRCGVGGAGIQADLENEEQIRAVPSRIAGRYGRLDVLVNCAALVGTSDLKGWAVPFQDQSADTWRRALEVNLTAPFILTQACGEMLAASGRGSVINVSSIYGVVGPNMSLYEGTSMGNPAAYGASKGGLIQLTKYLATALAPHVRVNAISPGGVWRNPAESFHQRYVSLTPLRRMATEEDFKGAAAFFASDASLYVTGQNLLIDGGWTAW